MWVLAYSYGLWLQNLILRNFAVLFLVCLVYLVLLVVPLGPCWCWRMGWQVFPQHWGGAAGYLLVREGCDETFLLVPLVALVSLGRWVESQACGCKEAFWTASWSWVFSVSSACFLLSFIRKGESLAQKRKESILPMGALVLLDIVRAPAGWSGGVMNICEMPSASRPTVKTHCVWVVFFHWEGLQDAQPQFCSYNPGVPNLLASFSLPVRALLCLSHVIFGVYSWA